MKKKKTEKKKTEKKKTEKKKTEKKKTEKKIKSSVYYDSDVSDMLLKLTEKYHLSRNRIHNMVLRKYLPEKSLWLEGTL
jgi:hypothetical protein